MPIQTMLHMIKQNNAVNIYQNYFEEIEPLELTECYSSRTITVFHNHGDHTMVHSIINRSCDIVIVPQIFQRPVTNLAWDETTNTQFVSSFSGKYQFNYIESSYVWDVGNVYHISVKRYYYEEYFRNTKYTAIGIKVITSCTMY